MWLQLEVVAANLLAQGYALAGSGYARQGWAANEGVEAGEKLIGYINSGAIAKTKKIMVWGNSLGALISSTIAERNPGKVAGVLASCGVEEGPMQAFEYCNDGFADVENIDRTKSKGR